MLSPSISRAGESGGLGWGLDAGQEECNNFDLVIKSTLNYIISLIDCRGSALLSKSIERRALLSFLEAAKSEGDAYAQTTGTHRPIHGAILHQQ